ncbi:hypothetical protein BGZ95_007123 [Linnemannia exigua]|uniref:Uncharacterized protein n=1 Tax=Linnemannia exigua TaxID=604196 RepID=A0AAD4D0E0_9FUNG|nr:hypothetical protein BGZ95_007123 [Linnemannia exigua]
MYSDTTGLISSFPFPNVHATPIQKDIHQASPIANNTRNMFFQGTRQNSSYLSYLTRPARVLAVEETNMTMQLTTIDLINPTPDTTTIINITTTTTWMDRYGDYKDVAMFQAIGGHLPGQQPFAVGLGVEGYYGMTLGGASMGSMIPFESGASIIAGFQVAEWRHFRSRLRNHNNQVVPGYKPPTKMDSDTELGIIIGSIVGGLVLLKGLVSFNSWLKKTRLAKEKHDADMNSYELIARLHHASVSSGDAGVSRGGTRFVSPPTAEELAAHQASATTSAHTLLDGLGLTRHPRPNTVITIAGDDEPSPIPYTFAVCKPGNAEVGGGQGDEGV